MFPKKLCSLGILDININLVLRKAQAEHYHFNINKYNSIEDLESIFFEKDNENKNNNKFCHKNENTKNKDINYFDYISLTSNNNLINTLLFINRAYKTKTFIEFIMLNQMEFSGSTKFVRKMIQEIFDKNYFFIIENNILDVPAKIKFTIKILNNDSDDILSMKSFELFEMNETGIERNMIIERNEELSSENNEEESEKKLLFERINKYKIKSILSIDKINYNFAQTDYFLFDLSLIKDFKISNKNDFSLIIYEIIKKYPKIKIILIIDDNINSIERESLKLNKKLIELSDIIFSFRDTLNNFLEIYNSSLKNDLKDIKNKRSYSFLNNSKDLEVIGNLKMSQYDLIIDDQDKCRKNIPRLTILLEDFSNVTIYKQQGIQMKIDYIETFDITTSNIKNKNKIEYLYSNNHKFAHIFIAGFLSRKIYEKSLRICVKAGDLLMKKSLYIFMNNIDYINDIDLYNVLVPSTKKNNNRKINAKIIKEYEELYSKENNFILDCTNLLKCQKKEYNPLFDENCASFLLKNTNMKHLKDVGFINKKGIILKDPDNVRKTHNNTLKNIKSRIFGESNYFLRNHKLPFNKTTYNTVSTNYESKELKNSPQFKRIFNPILENQIYNKIGILSPQSKNFKNTFYLPKMSKTYYNNHDKASKTLCVNSPDLKKSNSMFSRNLFIMSNKKRYLSVNNSKHKINNSNKKLYLLQKYHSHHNSNIFPSIFKTGFSPK